MLYKTIIHELLEQHPQAEQFRRQRLMLPLLEQISLELKSHHESWKSELGQQNPPSSPQLVSSQALELALEEIQNRLRSVPPLEDEPLTLDAAMAYLRNPTPPA